MLNRSGIAYFLLALFLLVTSFAGGAQAIDENLKQGLALMKGGKYVPAIKSFGAALKENPRDYRAYYFLGTCYQRCGDNNSASKMYSRAMKFGFKTPVFNKAATALQRIDPQAYIAAVSNAQGTQGAAPQATRAGARQGHAASRGASVQSQNLSSSRSSAVKSNPGDILPAECRIHYDSKPLSDHQYMTAHVNGRPITVLFDTGAESCAFGRNHLTQLGIAQPKGAPLGYSTGVGEGGAQATWVKRVDLKVGPITKKNFLISVIGHLEGEPLLGQTFFNNFHYTIDSGAKSIHFVRNDKSGVRQSVGSIYSSGNRNEVSFENRGKDIVVKVQVNGKEIPMFFDTGASGVLLSGAHLRQLGISIPSNPRTAMSNGVQGVSMNLVFPVSSIKMGPIEHRDFDIYVDPQATIPHPLLGQSFFKNYRYAIDNVNKVIKFTRIK